MDVGKKYVINKDLYVAGSQITAAKLHKSLGGTLALVSVFSFVISCKTQC